MNTAMRTAYTALPQGPSLRSGLCCPSPSSLNRPHPPHSRAHHDFAARRFIRDAFAVLSPRRPPSGSVLSLLVPSRHAALCDPGDLVDGFRPIASPTTLAFGSSGHARRSQVVPPSASGGSLDFGASLVHSFATACRVASLLDGSDRVSPAAETCTSGLSTRRSPFASPDMTTVALGQSPLAGLSPAGTAASYYPAQNSVCRFDQICPKRINPPARARRVNL